MESSSRVQHVHTAIIGAGHAGVECAWALRAAGVEGDVALFGAEAHAPYERPPLSKALLTGGTSAERIALRADSAYEKSRVVVVAGDPVASIDTAAHTLSTRSGRVVSYEHCVLATGASARGIAEVAGEQVYSVRGLDDAHRLREALRPGARLLVVGAGYLGLEAALFGAQAGRRGAGAGAGRQRDGRQGVRAHRLAHRRHAPRGRHRDTPWRGGGPVGAHGDRLARASGRWRGAGCGPGAGVDRRRGRNGAGRGGRP